MSDVILVRPGREKRGLILETNDLKSTLSTIEVYSEVDAKRNDNTFSIESALDLFLDISSSPWKTTSEIESIEIDIFRIIAYKN